MTIALPRRWKRVLGSLILLAMTSGQSYAAIGGYAVPGTTHGDGLPTVSLEEHLELRGIYFWADSAFVGRAVTEHSIVDDAIIPAIKARAHLRRTWWFDVRIFSPFGSGTIYDENWQGRFHLTEARMETVNISPAILWTNGALTVQAGPQLQLMRGVEFSQTMFFPGIVGAIAGGDSWGIGAQLAIAFRPWSEAEISLGYWSRVTHNMKGGHSGVQIFGLSELDLGGNKISLVTPDVFALQLEQKINCNWAVVGHIEYTLWSEVLRDIRIGFESSILPDQVVRYDAKDTCFLQLTGKWTPANTPWTVLANIGWGSNFTPDSRRHPSLIGGATWNLGVELRYEWSPTFATFVGARAVKWEKGKSELPGAKLPYGFPYGTLFGQLRGEYEATAYRFEVGIDLGF